MRTKHEFYTDVLRYDAEMKRKFSWSIVWLYALMFIPLLLSMICPCIGRNIWIVVDIGGLLLYLLWVRAMQRRVTHKHGMAYESCHKEFVLKHIGFTGICSHCSTQAFTE